MEQFDLYRDIKERTGGDMYIGVVGPVRTGKSTFIKRFMDLLVIPGIEDIHEKERANDELPQSAAGKTIMTTEPKFIPKDAVSVQLTDDVAVNVRMVDCVGYMVEGAAGHIENEQERMVKTPWFDEEIPFTQAAEIGTKKVIDEHSTIGVVITTDGSFSEIEREAYIKAEERAINELKRIGKPFIVLLNSTHPYSKETKEEAERLGELYKVAAMPVNCEQLKKEDITAILEQTLSVFPITQVSFHLPKWVEMLAPSHWLKQELIEKARGILDGISQIRDVTAANLLADSESIKEFHLDKIDAKNGEVTIQTVFDDKYYYEIISELTGMRIEDEYQMISLLKELAGKRAEFDKIGIACEEVRAKGYGVVAPSREEISIEEPEIIRHGNKFGVKIKAVSPSVHMIKANIETEIAPIVGSEEQAQDLIRYIEENGKDNPDGIWNTNIFGKSIRQLVDDGIQGKVNKLTEESQLKLQETIQKVINDSNGGLVCIII